MVRNQKIPKTTTWTQTATNVPNVCVRSLGKTRPMILAISSHREWNGVSIPLFLTRFYYQFTILTGFFFFFLKKKLVDGEHRRSFDTVHPLALDLGLFVDTSCKRNRVRCLRKHIDRYDGNRNILVTWRHGKMEEFAEQMGLENIPDYPEERWVGGPSPPLCIRF